MYARMYFRALMSGDMAAAAEHKQKRDEAKRHAQQDGKIQWHEWDNRGDAIPHWDKVGGGRTISIDSILLHGEQLSRDIRRNIWIAGLIAREKAHKLLVITRTVEHMYALDRLLGYLACGGSRVYIMREKLHRVPARTCTVFVCHGLTAPVPPDHLRKAMAFEPDVIMYIDGSPHHKPDPNARTIVATSTNFRERWLTRQRFRYLRDE